MVQSIKTKSPAVFMVTFCFCHNITINFSISVCFRNCLAGNPLTNSRSPSYTLILCRLLAHDAFELFVEIGKGVETEVLANFLVI